MEHSPRPAALLYANQSRWASRAAAGRRALASPHPGEPFPRRFHSPRRARQCRPPAAAATAPVSVGGDGALGRAPPARSACVRGRPPPFGVGGYRKQRIGTAGALAVAAARPRISGPPPPSACESCWPRRRGSMRGNGAWLTGSRGGRHRRWEGEGGWRVPLKPLDPPLASGGNQPEGSCGHLRPPLWPPVKARAATRRCTGRCRTSPAHHGAPPQPLPWGGDVGGGRGGGGRSVCQRPPTRREKTQWGSRQ